VMASSSDPKATVVPFLNPWFAQNGIPQIEVLVDWADAKAWASTLSTPVEFEIYVLQARTPLAVKGDSVGVLGTPIINSTELIARPSEHEMAPIRRAIDSYLDPKGLLSKYTFPVSNDLNSIAEAPDLGAFAPNGDSEPISIPHPSEFHQDVPRNSLRLLSHVAHLRLWQENVIARAAEAETDSRKRILTTSVGADGGPVLEALRSAARSEPIFGRALNVLHFFGISPAAFERLKTVHGDFLWLYARPTNLTSVANSDIALRPTRTVLDNNGACSYLDQDAESRASISSSDALRSFEAQEVTTYQVVSPAVFVGPRSGSHPHIVYTAETQAAVHGHVQKLKQSERSDNDIKTMLRFKRDADVNTFKSKCLHSIEGDVYGFEHIDRPYDSIGVVWDRRRALPTEQTKVAHVGYNGFRVDRVSSVGSVSTCAVERRLRLASGEDMMFENSGLVSLIEGHLPVDCQHDPTSGPYQKGTSAKQMDLLLPRNFLAFDGYNSVSASPLDGLVSTEADSDVEKAARPLVAVVNRSATEWLTHYGDIIGFDVRKVGITGMSPRTDAQRKATSLPNPRQSLTFLRYVPVQEPGTALSVVDMSSAHEDEKGQSSNVYQVTGSSPQLKLKTQYPLAHYKLILDSVSKIGDLGDDFNEACESFVRRATAKEDVAGFLRGFDPHATQIEVISKVWFPFSPNPGGDRFVVTGRSVKSTHSKGQTFSDLVVKAQRMLANGDYPEEFRVPVMMPGKYDMPAPKTQSDAQVLAGLKNRIQCRGGYDNPIDPQLSPDVFGSNPENPNAARAWTLNPIIHTALGQRPGIGGDVDDEVDQETIRGPITNYASMPDARIERYLLVPPTRGDDGSATSSSDAVTEPGRGTPFQWRKRLMPIPFVGSTEPDKKKYYSDNKDSFTKYVNFLSANVLKGDYRIAGQPALPGSPKISVEESGNYPIQAVWVGASRELAVPGFNFPRTVPVTEIAQSNDEFAYQASLGELLAGSQSGAQTRHLPFVDDDLVWVLRLQWKIDLKRSNLSRPHELCAVKEFNVYRAESQESGSPLETLIATLKVPSVAALRSHDLDRVWWVLFDGISDRLRHDYRYSIEAVPRDEQIFSRAKWFDVPIVVPSSTFDAQPEKLVPLPAQADPNRGFSFLFNAPSNLTKEKADQFRVALRVASAAGDPLLSTDPSAKALESPQDEIAQGQKANATLLKACSDPSGLSDALDYLFPTQPSIFAVESKMPDQPFATASGTSPNSVDGWTWAKGPVQISSNGKIVFSHALPGFEKTKNPFVKFHLAYYLSKNYPRLRHTTASDFVLSDWVQAFPDDLLLVENGPTGIVVKNPWGGNPKLSGKLDALVLMRFHIFVSSDKKGPDVPAFHVSTFYTDDSAVTYRDLGSRLTAGFTQMGIDPSVLSAKHNGLSANIVAEEGLWAMTSADSAAATGVSTVSGATFVVFRSTPKPLILSMSKIP